MGEVKPECHTEKAPAKACEGGRSLHLKWEPSAKKKKKKKEKSS